MMQMNKKAAKILSAAMSAAVCLSAVFSYGTGAGSAMAQEYTGDGEYTVTLYEPENGTIEFKNTSGNIYTYDAGDTVEVAICPDEGYELEDITVMDEEGDFLDTDVDSGYMTFEMPDEDVAAAAVFCVEGGSGDSTQTEKSQIDPDTLAFDTDDSTAYILENADPDFVGTGDELTAQDVLTVAMTTADSIQFDEMTLDGLWEDEDGDGEWDNLDAFVGMTYVYQYLYELSEDSDYYVAYIDTMNTDELDVAQVLTGLNDTSGTLYDDVVYDAGTGLIYIPKAYCADLSEENYDFMTVRTQILYVTNENTEDVNSITTNVDVSIDSGNLAGDISSDCIVEASIHDESFDIQLVNNARGLRSVSEDTIISVSVNGAGFDADSGIWSYDDNTGSLTIDMSPSSVNDVSVEMGTNIKTILSTMVSNALDAVSVDADAAESDIPNVGATITFSGTPAVGEYFKAYSSETYVKSGSSSAYDTAGYWGSLAEVTGNGLVKALLSGSGIDLNNLELHSSHKTDSNAYERVSTINTTTVNTSRGNTAKFSSNFSINLECAHIGVNNNFEYESGFNHPSGSSTDGTYCRIIKITGGYAYIGAVVTTAATQAGAGVFKAKITYSAATSTAYYKARDAFLPSLAIHIEKSDTDTGEMLSGATFEIYRDGTKAATITTDKDGKASYTWVGNAVYTDYSTSTKKYCVNYSSLTSAQQSAVTNNGYYTSYDKAFSAAKTEVQNAVSSALSTKKANTTHTWKIIETKAPDGYKLNDMVFEQKLSANTTAIEVDFTNVSDGGYLKLAKSSGNESLTDGNGCYSLEGAVYGVYESREDALKDTNRVATLTTDVDGNTDTVSIGAKKWYVKEITASPGYKLCDGTDDADEDGIHEIQVTSENTENNPAVVECVEPPANDPFALTLQKLDAETGEAAQGTASFEGAIFALEYYTNTDGDTSGDPFKTWYFKTDEDGYFKCDNEKYLVSSHIMNDDTVLISDESYKDASGEIIYPVGTYRIYEVSPPKLYQLFGYMHFVQDTSGKTDVTTGLKAVIKQSESGGDANIYDGDNILDDRQITAANLFVNVYDDVNDTGSITIYKQKSDGSKDPLSGVTFKLVGLEEGDEHTATTDKDGKIVWDNLIPQNYVITEVKTVDGYNLLKDNIEVTIPMEMTFEEIRKDGADISQAVYDEASGKYCFYNVTLTVGNTATFDMPMTGGSQAWYLVLVVAGGLAAGLAVIFRKRKTA